MLSLSADYVGASVNGIPGLHLDTDNNRHESDRARLPAVTAVGLVGDVASKVRGSRHCQYAVGSWAVFCTPAGASSFLSST